MEGAPLALITNREVVQNPDESMPPSFEVSIRRVAAGKTGSDEALKQLCSLPKERRIFNVDILSAILRWLSQHSPPTLLARTGISLEFSGDVTLAMVVLEAIATVFRLDIASPDMVTVIRRYWSATQGWISFLVRTYVEPILPSLDNLAVRSLSAIVFIYSACLHTNTIRTQEIDAISGAVEMIASSVIYSLYVDRAFLTSENIDIFKNARILLSSLTEAYQAHFNDILERTLNDSSTPTATADLMPVLSRFCQEPKLDYGLLTPWISIVSDVAFWPQFNKPLVKSRSVYFVTYLLSRISKDIVAATRRLRSASSRIEPKAIEELFWPLNSGVHYLINTFAFGGYDSIILSLRTGLLQMLWRITKIIDLAPLPQKLTGHDIYGKLLNVIGGYTLYRSVQKVVWKAMLKTNLFREIEKSRDKNKTIHVWGEFTDLFQERLKLRSLWQSNIHQLAPPFRWCSNDACVAGPDKVYRCVGCKIAIYCSRSCQKSHWPHHRKSCQDHERMQKSGFPRVAEERDSRCYHWMVSYLLCGQKEELWKLQDSYLESARKNGLPDTILLNIVDFALIKLRKDVGTLQDAMEYQVISREWFSEQILSRKEAMVGPIALALIPHPVKNTSYPLLLGPELEAAVGAINKK